VLIGGEAVRRTVAAMTSPTRRRRHGDAAEDVAVSYLRSLGWHVVARNIGVGRDEIDVLALDAGPPPEMVCVEVRSNVSGRFGTPEESVVGGKARRLYRSMAALRSGSAPVDDMAWPRGISWRVDLVVVEMAPSIGRDAGGPRIRHLCRLEPDAGRG
jgi:Holliday junction resolvase-like predicted endonuclease